MRSYDWDMSQDKLKNHPSPKKAIENVLTRYMYILSLNSPPPPN